MKIILSHSLRRIEIIYKNETRNAFKTSLKTLSSHRANIEIGDFPAMSLALDKIASVDFGRGLSRDQNFREKALERSDVVRRLLSSEGQSKFYSRDQETWRRDPSKSLYPVPLVRVRRHACLLGGSPQDHPSRMQHAHALRAQVRVCSNKAPRPTTMVARRNLDALMTLFEIPRWTIRLRPSTALANAGWFRCSFELDVWSIGKPLEDDMGNTDIHRS